VVNPVGESKSEYEIHQLLAQRLGIGEAFPPYETFLKKAYETSYAATKLGIP